MDIVTRLTNLENLVQSMIKNQSMTDEYKTADIEGCRNTEERQAKEIQETSNGLIETYEATITNENSISECEDALMELYEMIIGE